MRPQEILSQRERATKALGAAMLAAIEMTVREYMNPGQGEDAAPLPFAAELFEEESAAEVNENFDLARFYRMRGMEDEENTVRRGERGAAVQMTRADERRDAEGYAAPTFGAQEISEQFERDARRYDAPFRAWE